MGWGGLGWGGCRKWTARKLHSSFTECLAGVARVWRKRIGFESSQRVFFLGKKSRIFHPKISSDVKDFPTFHDFAHEETNWNGRENFEPSWDVSVVCVNAR